MSEQEDSVLSKVSISTGVIPFPSMDSSLLRQTLSDLQGTSSSTSEPMMHPSASTPALSEPSMELSSKDDVSTLPLQVTISNDMSPTPSREPVMKESRSNSVAEESHVTASSSRLTSSDKLSALPSSMIPLSSNATRNTRPPTLSVLSNIQRGYRRSLDTVTSLPPFSSAGHEPAVPNNSVLSITPSFHPRNEANSNIGIFQRHPTPENTSGGKETPKQRVSFESDHASLPAMPSVGQAFSRLTKGSDHQTTSPALRSTAYVENRDVDSYSNIPDIGSRSQSQTRSRPTSPLRIFQHWSSGLRGHRASVEDPFVPVNPFKSHLHNRFRYFHNHDLESGNSSAFSGPYDCDDLIPTKSIKSFFNNVCLFTVDTLPRQIYLHFLLCLPALYFSRVARIFEDAEVSKPDIQRLINDLCRGDTAAPGPGMMPTGDSGMVVANGTWEANVLAQSTPAHIPMTTFSSPGIIPPRSTSASPQIGAISPIASIIHTPLPFPDEWAPPIVSPALIRFKHSWEAFIDSLLREWKTLNLISALLASTILTIFQVPAAGDDPVTRTAAFLSLICALMSLTYGCMYIVRFGTMKNMFYASRWAEAAHKDNASILWNVWVLLAMPAIWMAWAMLSFMSAILSFVWRTGSVSDPADRPPLGDRAVLGPRIAITCVFFLGLVYLAMIVRTFQNYEGPTRALLQQRGTGAGSTSLPGGGRAQTHGNMAQGQGGGTGEKKIRARDIDAAMERRGRQRERSTSTTNIRRREEDVERRRQSGIGYSGRKNGRNSKGLGFGSRIRTYDSGELAELPELEMDLKIAGLP